MPRDKVDQEGVFTPQSNDDWYDRNAGSFIEASLALDVSALRDRFIAPLPPGAHILDAGCGAGRDVRAFLDTGFRVTAFDASEEMCHSARNLSQGRADIRHCSFETFDPSGVTFDAIWAMASLVHLPSVQIAPTISRLAGYLAPYGRLYTSLKEGVGEEQDAKGRHMSFLSQSALHAMLSDLPFESEPVETWVTYSPGSQGEMTAWVNGLVVRAD
jgi:SAM-dependent methyltransferase